MKLGIRNSRDTKIIIIIIITIIRLTKYYIDLLFRTLSEASQNIQFYNIVTQKMLRRISKKIIEVRPPGSISLPDLVRKKLCLS